MQEKVKGFLESGKRFWKNTGKNVKIALAVLLVLMLAVIGILVAYQINKPYATLFTELNQSDLTAIVSYLSDQGITDFKISGNNTILVPEDQENSLKAQLLTQGYPNSGFAYSTYFDHVGSLTTEAERNTLILYELQDRTAAVIRSMDGVQDAVVQFTPGEDNTYVLDTGNVVEASAYVAVTMKAGRTLEATQAKGIQTLVSRALQGLKVENISIVDSYGNVYSPSDTVGNIQDSSQLKLQLETQVNNTVRTNIMQVLAPLYGTDNVRVSVNSNINVDRIYTDATDYSLEDWAQGGSTGGEGIIGKKIYDQQVVRDDGTVAGGIAGSETNSDIPTYNEDELETNGNETASSISGEKEYLVDQQKQQTEHMAGTVTDLMVSVTINADAGGSVSEEDLYAHIARAAGISAVQQQEKIHVLVAPFYQPSVLPLPSPEELPEWVLYAAIGGGALVLILLLVLLISHRRRKKKARLAEKALQDAQARERARTIKEGAEIMDMQTEKSMELRKDVRKFAEENPEIAAQMVKSWLREGDSTE